MQTLGVQVVVNGQQQAGAALDATASKFDKFKAKLGKAQLPATLAIGGIVALGKKFGEMASDAQQAMGGVESVFGKNSKTIEKWADGAANSVGLAKTEYAELATKFGAQFKNMGLSQDKVLDGTEDMVKLGADLAATYGGTTKDAVEALSSAFKGEADPIERYGINLKQTAINAELAKRGQDKLTGAALQQARAAAIMSIATKQAGGSIGQFGREADTAAGQQQRANAAWKNTQAQLGEALLPIMAMFAAIIGKVSGLLGENAAAVRIVAGVILGAAVAIKVLNAAMNASPIARIIALVALLAAGLAVAWQKSETFRNIVTGVWNAVKSAAETAWKIIQTVITTVWNVISGIWNGAKALFTGIFNAVKAVIETYWKIYSGIITGVYNVIKAVWDGLVGFLAGVWSRISGAVAGAWALVSGPITAVIEAVKTAWNAIVSWFNDLWDKIAGPVTAAWSAVSAPITAVVDAIKAVWDGLTGFFTGLWDGIKGIVSDAVEWISEKVGWIIDRIKDIGDWFNKQTQLVDSGSLLTGSAGAGLRVPAATGPTVYNGGAVTINVTGAGRPDQVARDVADLLRRRERRTGGVQL